MAGVVDHVADGVDHQLGVAQLNVVVAPGVGDVLGVGELLDQQILSGQLRRPQCVGELLVDAGGKLTGCQYFGSQLRGVGGEDDHRHVGHRR